MGNRRAAMMDLHFLLQQTVHLGAILYLVGFLFRNQIWLRIFVIAGDLAYVTYYFNISDQPLWGAIFWNVPNVLVNVVMIWQIMKDNHTSNFTEDELKFYSRLGDLPVAEFRKIVRLGAWREAKTETLLTTEGKEVEYLYYILEGEATIERADRRIVVKPGLFIGEVAYLRGRPASATVHIAQGSKYIVWDSDKLRLASEKNINLKLTLSSMLNDDMADKVARSL